jgi:hypothetical protein
VKTALAVLAGALVVIVVFVVARGGLSVDLGSGTSGGSGSGGGTGGGHLGGPDPIVDPPAPDPVVDPPPDPGDTRGGPDVSFRGTTGTDHVDCARIATELKVSAYGGRIHWTATAPSGVTISPSSGDLDEGDSQVLSIGGTYAGGRSFPLKVSAPNRAGRGASTQTEFVCT